MTAPAGKAPDYGEPFGLGRIKPLGPTVLTERDGETLQGVGLREALKRANVLAGCPDPKGLIDDLKWLVQHCKKNPFWELGQAINATFSEPLKAWLREESK